LSSSLLGALGGQFVYSRSYDAFGLRTGGAGGQPFRFAGAYGYQEDASGLKLLGHRYYDPSTGRFISSDPIRDGRNWYAYCDNSPLGSVDPTGLMRADIARGAGVLADTELKGTLAMRPLAWPHAAWLQKLLSWLGIGGVSLSIEGDGPRVRPKRRRPQPIYRAVEPPEQSALRDSGGIPTPSPHMGIYKLFRMSEADARKYATMAHKYTGQPQQIWFWPNPYGVGHEGPMTDGMRTWLVEPHDLPRIGPGFPLPTRWR